VSPREVRPRSLVTQLIPALFPADTWLSINQNKTYLYSAISRVRIGGYCYLRHIVRNSAYTANLHRLSPTVKSRRLSHCLGTWLVLMGGSEDQALFEPTSELCRRPRATTLYLLKNIFTDDLSLLTWSCCGQKMLPRNRSLLRLLASHSVTYSHCADMDSIAKRLCITRRLFVCLSIIDL